jgi:hypothetical protein
MTTIPTVTTLKPDVSLTRYIKLYPLAKSSTPVFGYKNNADRVREAIAWAELNKVRIQYSFAPFDYSWNYVQSCYVYFQDEEQMLAFLLQFSDIVVP